MLKKLRSNSSEQNFGWRRMKTNARGGWVCRRAYTLVETMTAVFVLAIMLMALYVAISTGFSVASVSRDNLRATQILMQKMEALRLYKWTQLTNASYLKPTFADWYDPSSTNTHSGGTLYTGVVTMEVPTDLPDAYKSSMRAVTVTLFWTNYPHKPANTVIVRSRQMQTLVARYGMQPYIFR